MATQTRRVQIGTYVLLLPLHHPVRVAEDAAVVDILSGGRLLLGFGVGYRPDEFAGLGYPKQLRGRLQEEGVEIIQKCFTEDTFDHDEPTTTCAASRSRRSRSSGRTRRLTLVASAGRSSPARRVWTSRASAAGRAAVDWAAFRDEMAVLGRDPDVIRNAPLQFMYVAESDDQAPRRRPRPRRVGPIPLCPLVWRRRRIGLFRPRRGGDDPRQPGDLPAPLGGLLRSAPRSPDHHLVVQLQLAGLDHQKALRAMDFFAEHILPRLHAGESKVQGPKSKVRMPGAWT